MAIRVASSNLENFRISGELDELTPSNSNGLVSHVHFEGGLSYYRSLNNVKILCISRFYNSGHNYQWWLDKAGACIDLIKCESSTEVTEQFIALEADTYKNYDLILVNNSAWYITTAMINKATTIIQDGISVFTCGNDTRTHRYVSATINVSATDETAQYLTICNDLPFRYPQRDRYIESKDGKQIITKLSNEAIPIIKRDDGNIAAFLVQEEASLFHDNDNSIPQNFILAMCEYLVSRSTGRIKTSDGSNNKMIFTENGVACMNTTNLWDGFEKSNGGSFPATWGSTSNIEDIPNMLPNCPFVYNTHNKIIKFSPKTGLSYRYIDITDVPEGTYMTLSAWVFVDYNFNGRHTRLKVEKNGIFKESYYDIDKIGTWQHINLPIYTTTGIFRFLLYVGSSLQDVWTTGNVYFANVKLEKDIHVLEYNPLGAYKSPKITVPVNDIGNSFSVILKLKRMADYKKMFTDGSTFNKAVYNLNSNVLKDSGTENKAITYKDYYGGLPLSNSPWYGHDDFMTSSDGAYWHLHLGDEAGNFTAGDDEIIIFTKNNDTVKSYIFRNNKLYEISQVYTIQDLIDFSLDSIDLFPDCASYIRDVFVYNRALSTSEIKTYCSPKHLSFTTDGDILSKRLIEKPFIDKSVVYFPLSWDVKDYYGLYSARKYDGIQFIDNAALISSSLTNLYTGISAMTPFNLSTPLIKRERLNEVEFTILPSDPASTRGIYFSRSPNNVILDASQRYELTFEVFCEDEITLWLDLNSGGKSIATPTNDNYTSVVGSRTFNTTPNRWLRKRVMYTMLPDLDTQYICFDVLGITSDKVITKPTTLKVRNICYRPIADDRIDLPYTDIPITNSKLQFKLHEEIGLDWSGDWTIIFNKKPLTTHSGVYEGYCIDSLGCNNNSVGGGYLWFGKASGLIGDNANLRLKTDQTKAATININKFFNDWHVAVLKKEGNKITYKIFPRNAETLTIECEATSITNANHFVCQGGYDLFLGGFDTTVNGTNLYRDLIISREALSDDDITKIAKTFLKAKTDSIKVNNELIEKSIL